MEEPIMLAAVLIVVGLLAASSWRKSGGTTQAGIDASVKAVVWTVCALIAAAYLMGVA
jgi:hypothetical protein